MPTNRWLGLGIETVYGSNVALTKFIKIEDESIKEKIDWYDHETVGYDTPDDSYIVKRQVSGDITWVPCPDEIGEFLHCMLPKYAYSTTGTADTHTYDNGTSAECPSMTIRVRRDFSEKASYVGIKPSTLEFSAEAGKPLVVTATVIGKDQSAVAGGVGSAAAFMADQVFLLTRGSFKVNGSQNANVKAVNIKIDYNYDADGDMALGTASMSNLRYQGLKVTGAITLTKPDTSIYGTYYRQGTFGSLHVKFMAKTSAGTVRPLYLRIPSLHWQEANEGNISKRELNEAEYNFVANYSTGSALTIQAILENNHGTSYPNT